MSARFAALAAQMRDIATRHARPAAAVTEPRPPWYQIRNAADDRVIVQIDGEIGWDVSSSTFVKDLRAITAPAIDLHINSVGGSAWDGYAIYNALETHPATITSHIVGVAASAASFIAMAGDEIVAYRPSEMMIHDAAGWIDIWGILNPADIAQVIGDMAQLQSALNQTSDEIAAMYARKAGGTVLDWRERMQATTWYTPDTALAAGLVDRINGDDDTNTTPAAPPGTNDIARPAPAAHIVRAHARRILEGGVK